MCAKLSNDSQTNGDYGSYYTNFVVGIFTLSIWIYIFPRKILLGSTFFPGNYYSGKKIFGE